MTGAPKWPPADLEGSKALLSHSGKVFGQRARLTHQERSIRQHAIAVSPAEQPPNRLSRDLAEDVPHCDVDATDRVGHRSATPHPKCVGMQFLAHALRLQGSLAQVERCQQL